MYVYICICVCVGFPFPKMDPVHWSFLVTKCRNLEANFYVSRLGWSHVKKIISHIAVIWISLGAHPSSWSFAFPLFGPLAWSGVNGRSLPAPVVAKCCSSRDLRDGEFRLTVCDQPCCPSYGTLKLLSGNPNLKPFFSQAFCTDTVRDVPPFQRQPDKGETIADSKWFLYKGMVI
jgi:hypothetical protein